LAKAVAEHKINVNCVAPGAVRRTAMHKWALDAFGAAMNITPDEFYQRELDAITILGQEITPEDVANAMLFLVSEESRNLTGYVIYVDGGFPGYKW
jgi:NAD(P)-dependent dehydrogenase (short-subunit alcohol dehydrogenase family)